MGSRRVQYGAGAGAMWRRSRGTSAATSGAALSLGAVKTGERGHCGA
jgi:hypothetical protein